MPNQLTTIQERALAPFKRASGAIEAIRISVRAIVKAHAGGGQVRIMPIYQQTGDSWIDEHGQLQSSIERHWIGLAWFKDGAIVHEVRWNQASANRTLPRHRDRPQ